jgi:hypothetical protein
MDFLKIRTKGFQVRIMGDCGGGFLGFRFCVTVFALGSGLRGYYSHMASRVG